GFRDGIESMHDQVIAEPVPGWIFAALDTDVDEHEGLTQKARLHHPVGELAIGIGKQIQTLLLATFRGPLVGCVPAMRREEDTSIPMIKKGGARNRCSAERARGGRSLQMVHGTFLPARRNWPLLGLTGRF